CSRGFPVPATFRIRHHYSHPLRREHPGMVPAGGSENNRITFFAYEWTKPWLGKVIKEIRLKGTTGFRGAPRGFTDDYGPPISNNGVILIPLAATAVRRAVAQGQGAKEQLPAGVPVE